MDFNDSPDEKAYRQTVRQWLAKEAEAFKDIDFESMTEQEELPYSRRWLNTKAKAGYAAIALPKNLGGGGGTSMQSIIFHQEQAKFNLPSYVYFAIGLGMCLPTMMSFASDSQKQALMPKLMSGENIWCQLFSEPSAGSDLGNVRTKAIKNGDDWIINGQKVWTTQGHLADYGILVVRTNPDVPKHKGLSFFFLDMKSPGVEVRPIKQIDGNAEFNEIFFTDVRIADSQRLGEVGDGWKVALTTLMFERQSGSEHSLGMVEYQHVLDFIHSLSLDGKPAFDDSAVQEQVADWYLQMEGLRFVLYRRLTALAAGTVPGAEAAMGKLVEAKAVLDISRYCLDLLGESGALSAQGNTALDTIKRSLLKAPGIRIAGGTDEILRNTIAERVLGLPQDVRTDKTKPFKELIG